MRPAPYPTCYGEQARLEQEENAALRERMRELEQRLAGLAVAFTLGTLTVADAKAAVDFSHGSEQCS